MTAILIVALALLALGLLSLVHRAQEVEDQLEKAREEVATRLPQGVSQVQEVAKSALAAVRARAQRVRLRGTNSEPAVTLRGYETTACLAWSGLAGADANVQTWQASGRDEVRAQRGSEVASDRGALAEQGPQVHAPSRNEDRLVGGREASGRARQQSAQAPTVGGSNGRSNREGRQPSGLVQRGAAHVGSETAVDDVSLRASVASVGRETSAVGDGNRKAGVASIGSETSAVSDGNRKASVAFGSETPAVNDGNLEASVVSVGSETSVSDGNRKASVASIGSETSGVSVAFGSEMPAVNEASVVSVSGVSDGSNHEVTASRTARAQKKLATVGEAPAGKSNPEASASSVSSETPVSDGGKLDVKASSTTARAREASADVGDGTGSLSVGPARDQKRSDVGETSAVNDEDRKILAVPARTQKMSIPVNRGKGNIVERISSGLATSVATSELDQTQKRSAAVGDVPGTADARPPVREYPAVEAMSQTKHVASTPVEAPAKTEAVPQTTNMLAQKTDGPEADDTSPDSVSEKLNQVASAPSLREPSRAESQPQTTADMVAELHVPAHTATWPQADFDYATLWASVLHGVADMGAFLQARYGRMLEPGAQTGVATRENLCHAIDRAGPLQLSALLETTTEGVALLSLAPYLEGDSMHVVRIEQVDASAQGLEATVVGQLGTNFIRFVDSLYMPNRGTYARGARAVFAIGGVVAALELGPADACVSGLEGQEQVAGELPKTRFCGVVEEVEEHAFYGIPLLRYRLSLAGSQRSLSLVAHPYTGPREIELGDVVSGEAWLIGHRPQVFTDVVYACNDAADGTPATAFAYAEALCAAHQVALAECPSYCRVLLEQLCTVVGQNPEVRGIVGLLARALGELRMQAEDVGGTAALDRHLDLLSRLRRSFPDLSILEVAIRLARGSGGENFVREPEERGRGPAFRSAT